MWMYIIESKTEKTQLLLLVDILSRKAWAYVLTKSKKEKRAEVSVKTLEDFK